MASIQEQVQKAFARHEARQFDAAEQLYRQILRRAPEHAETLYLLSALRADQGDPEQALTLLKRAIASDPTQARYHNNLGAYLLKAERPEEARAAYERALELQPDYPQALFNLGYLLRQDGDLSEAQGFFERTVALKPDWAEARGLLGTILHNRGLSEEALPHLRQSLRGPFASPDDVHTMRGNLGVCLQALGAFDEARACYDQILAEAPTRYEAHMNLALLLLLQGEMEQGWAEYEWRLQTPQARRQLYSKPRWDGSPLAGRTLLVYSEQGYGDSFQFARYLPLIPKGGGGQVIFEGQPGTKTALERCAGIDLMIERPESNVTEEAVPYDVQIPLASLPHLFPHPLEAPPGRQPYLTADPERVAAWGHRIAAFCDAIPQSRLDDLKVGIVWAGNPNHKNDRHRSLSLNDLAPLAQIPGVTLFSLQRGPSEAQTADPPAGMTLVDLAPLLRDFAETAAALHHLDLLITVDTSVAHVAGAMGKPFWVMLPFTPDFRWLLQREDSPWYPTARLFRQPRRWDWETVVARLSEALQETATRRTLWTEQIDEAEARFAAGDIAGAKAQLQDLAAHRLPHPRVLNNLGVIHWRQGDAVAALTAFSQALEANPQDATARANCAAVLRALGHEDDARALETMPETMDSQDMTASPEAKEETMPTPQTPTPKISVMICTYNRRGFLQRALEGYERQTLPASDFEVVVIDDASPDDTAEFMADYQKTAPFHVTYFRQPENKGIGAGRKRSVELARGEVVLLADDDEIARPDYLEQHLRIHAQYPQENYGTIGRIELAKEVADSVTLRIATGGHGMYHHFDHLHDGQRLNWQYFWGCVTSVKRSFLLRHAPFADTRAQEDIEMGFRLDKSGLVLIFNQQAVMDTFRPQTLSGLCRRNRLIGAATPWLLETHTDCRLPFAVGVADAEEQFPAIEREWQQSSSIIEKMEALEQIGWNALSQRPDFRTQTFPALMRLCQIACRYHFLAGYLEALEQRHAAQAAAATTIEDGPLVSVVVTSYNYGRYLRDSVGSILRQTYRNFEIIIVDDGSSDDTIEVAQQLIAENPAQRIRLITQPNSGHPAHARNRGLAEAQGEYFLCLDADDMAEPIFLAECVGLLEKNPELSIAFTDQVRFNDRGEEWTFHAGDYRPELLPFALTFGQCTVYRRKAWEDAGPYQAMGFEDWNFWLSCLEKSHFGRRIPKKLYRYRKHENGKYKQDIQKGVLHKAQMILNHPTLYDQAAQQYAKNLLAAHEARFEIEAETVRAEQLFQAGDAATAQTLLMRLDLRFPGQTRILNDLGAIFWQTGDRVRALQHFQRALEADPDDHTTVLNCADALRGVGRPEQADRLLRSYAEKHPETAPMRLAA